MKQRVFALIPARGGSKGIPGKNLANLLGKPLIVHTIEAAQMSRVFLDIIVSSDDDKILQVAETNRVRALKRPMELATDQATSDAVVEHAIRASELSDDDIVVLLQPTSPLRNGDDIRRAVAMFNGNGCVVSMCETEECPYKAYLQHGEEIAPLFGKDDAFKPRQSFPKTYKPNGAIYVFTVKAFRQNSRIPREPHFGYEMPAERSIDIDRPLDLQIAELLLKGSNL